MFSKSIMNSGFGMLKYTFLVTKFDSWSYILLFWIDPVFEKNYIPYTMKKSLWSFMMLLVINGLIVN